MQYVVVKRGGKGYHSKKEGGISKVVQALIERK